MVSRCSATRRDGQPCKAPAAPGSDLCVFHDPAQREAAQRIRANGARAANKLRAIEGRRAKIDTALGLLKFAASLVHRVVEGEVAPEVGAAAFRGIAVCHRLVELAEIEARVKRLQAAQERSRWA